MPKIGRNDPCPCGSGKKYKQCHGPIDAQRDTELRLLRQAPDTLLEKIMDAAPGFAAEFAPAVERFWNGKHTVAEIEQLDDLEERGAERFLTWFMFDCRNAEGTTPLQRLALAPDEIELTPQEAQLLQSWTVVRLQPYEIVEVQKGQGFTARPLWGEASVEVEDHAASRRVQDGEVVIVHLAPVVDRSIVLGAAAQLTGDTVQRLQELADLHLEDLRRQEPDAGHAELIRDRSEIFNHFIMALPREEKGPDQLQTLLDNTRVLLAMAGSRLGLRREIEPAESRLHVISEDGELATEDAEANVDEEIAMAET